VQKGDILVVALDDKIKRCLMDQGTVFDIELAELDVMVMQVGNESLSVAVVQVIEFYPSLEELRERDDVGGK